jgi:hypothetical protein
MPWRCQVDGSTTLKPFESRHHYLRAVQVATRNELQGFRALDRQQQFELLIRIRSLMYDQRHRIRFTLHGGLQAVPSDHDFRP